MITTYVSVLSYEEPWILTSNASMHIWINRWSDKGTDYDSLFSWMDISSASPDVQMTGKQGIGCIMFCTLCPTTGQFGLWTSWAVFLSDRTVSACISLQQDSRQYGNHGYMRFMCPLNKLYHFQALLVQHSQLDQPYIPPYFVHNQYILNSMNSTTKPLYFLQIYYLPCSPYMATPKWPLPNCCHYAYNILNKMPIF